MGKLIQIEAKGVVDEAQLNDLEPGASPEALIKKLLGNTETLAAYSSPYTCYKCGEPISPDDPASIGFGNCPKCRL